MMERTLATITARIFYSQTKDLDRQNQRALIIGLDNLGQSIRQLKEAERSALTESASEKNQNDQNQKIS